MYNVLARSLDDQRTRTRGSPSTGSKPTPDSPPKYSTRSSPSQPPPSYAELHSFPIGNIRSPKLVSESQLKGHLGLIRAFVNLRKSAQNDKAPGIAIPDEVRRWSLFVNLAVERFERWCHTLTLLQASSRNMMWPPIDVIMVWHTYLLNPGWYAEDTERVSLLSRVALIPLPLDLSELHAEPTPERIQSWEDSTGLPFDPIESSHVMRTRNVRCPKCTRSTQACKDFFLAGGHGYAQQDFMLACPKPDCSHIITKDTLALAKFVDDLVDRPNLAGTVFTSTETANLVRATEIRDMILKSPLFSLPGLARRTSCFTQVQAMGTNQTRNAKRGILKNVEFLRFKAKEAMSSQMRDGGRGLSDRIMSAYADDRPFSIELVGAVLRQGSFNDKMVNLGWTETGCFTILEMERALQHAVARYHAFLDLMSSSRGFFVPTLDIDLAWHTHQLQSRKYQGDVRRLVGRFVDHDDKVDESRLADSFDTTCQAWKKKFNIDYMHCGCPKPGDSMGRRLSRIVGSKPAPSPPYLIPPIESNILASTHPSDHNAVYATHRKKLADGRRKERQALANHRRVRDDKGKMKQQQQTRRDAHEMAFLLPVPVYDYGCTMGSGTVMSDGYGASSCASVGCGSTSVGAASVSGCGSACGGGGDGGGCGGGCGGGD